jgi:hypothetical protein
MPTQAYCYHMNKVFANHCKEDNICPLTTEEVVEAQRADASLKHPFKHNAVIDQGMETNAVIDQGWEIKLIENTTCVCKDGWWVIPKPL